MNELYRKIKTIEAEIEEFLKLSPAEQLLESDPASPIDPLTQLRLNEKQLNEQILKLGQQEDPMLKSEKNYPPGGYANGGNSKNFNQTVELLNFADGKDVQLSFENFTKVLNEYPTKNGESNLLGTTAGKGEKFKKKRNINIYTTKEKENISDLITSVGTVAP